MWARDQPRLTILAVFAAIAFDLSLSSAQGAVNSVAPLEREHVYDLVVEGAEANPTVPTGLALAVARVESDFQGHVTSSAGARGVMQIMPATAMGEFGVAAVELWEPRTNIRLGIAFLERLYVAYGSRWDLALSHYNGGSLRKSGDTWQPHTYTQEYVAAVMAHWESYERMHPPQEGRDNPVRVAAAFDPEIDLFPAPEKESTPARTQKQHEVECDAETASQQGRFRVVKDGPVPPSIDRTVTAKQGETMATRPRFRADRRGLIRGYVRFGEAPEGVYAPLTGNQRFR